MVGANNSFDKRLNRIGLSGHRRSSGRTLKNGYVPMVGPDGLIVVRRRKRGPSIPFRGLIYLAFGFILFKAVALAQFGEDGYNGRLETMSEGTAVEQASSWVMQADRVTLFVASKIRPILH